MLRNAFRTAVLVTGCIALPLLAQDRKYNARVYLDKITVVKVVEGPLDSQEDLCGSVKIANVKFPADGSSPRQTTSDIRSLWREDRNTPMHLGQGQSRTFSNVFMTLGDRLTLAQVKHLEFTVNSLMVDTEGINNNIAIRYNPCSSCESIPEGTFDVDSANGKRRMMLETYAAQIDAIAPGGSKFLRIGSDDTFQLDFFEGDSNSSHVRAVLKIKITRAN